MRGFFQIRALPDLRVRDQETIRRASGGQGENVGALRPKPRPEVSPLDTSPQWRGQPDCKRRCEPGWAAAMGTAAPERLRSGARSAMADRGFSDDRRRKNRFFRTRIIPKTDICRSRPHTASWLCLAEGAADVCMQDFAHWVQGRCPCPPEASRPFPLAACRHTAHTLIHALIHTLKGSILP